MTRRPARRFAVLGIGSIVGAFLLISGYLAALDVRYHHARDRATAIAAGTVVRAGDTDTDIRVAWTDEQGRRRTQQFSVYDSYEKGDEFDVRYDPQHPNAKAFAADPDETAESDDLEVPIAIAGVVALGFAGGWAFRWLAYRQARVRERRTSPAILLSGAPNDGSPLTLGRSLWMRLGERRWQKVMWQPELAGFTSGEVTVRGDLDGRRRVVVELPDGTMLVPASGLKHKPPRRVALVPEDQARPDDDEHWIFPAGTPVPPQHRWWRQPASLALVGGAVGAFMGVVFADARAVPALAVGVAALAVNGWAMTSPSP